MKRMLNAKASALGMYGMEGVSISPSQGLLIILQWPQIIPNSEKVILNSKTLSQTRLQ